MAEVMAKCGKSNAAGWDPSQNRCTRRRSKLDLAAEEKATSGIRATGPDGKDFTIRFDKESGFRTRELLAVPMISTQDEGVGVLETLNHLSADGEPSPFGKDDEELLMALGGQAASAIENALIPQLPDSQVLRKFR